MVTNQLLMIIPASGHVATLEDLSVPHLPDDGNQFITKVQRSEDDLIRQSAVADQERCFHLGGGSELINPYWRCMYFDVHPQLVTG